MKAFLLTILTAISFSSYADICGTVIAGASLQGYTSDMGGYDGNGLCHVRNISQDQCQRLTGKLYVDYSADHGKGFSHCSFNPPSGSRDNSRDNNSSPSSPRTSRCSSMQTECGGGCMPLGAVCCGGSFYCDAGKTCLADKCHDQAAADRADKKHCDDAQLDFQTEFGKLGAKPSLSELLSGVISLSKWQLEKVCPRGQQNYTEYAIDQYNKAVAAARARESAPKSTPAPQSDTKHACAASPSATAWCRSDSGKLSQQKQCFMEAVQTGDDNYSIALKPWCKDEIYMASVATYDENGVCTRDVITLRPSDHYTAQIISSTHNAKTPHVIDAIMAEADPADGYTTSALQTCYDQRHNGCGCQ